MDDRTLRILEYNKIKEALASCAACSLGKRRALAMAPRNDVAWIRQRLAETTEARWLLQDLGNPPLGGLTDFGPVLSRARSQGLLAPEDLLQIADAMRCARRVREYLGRAGDEAPYMTALGEQLSLHPGIEDEVERCIDEQANVRSRASEKLHRLNGRAETLERRGRERMDAILRREADRGTLQEPVIVQRAGRLCLPVQANQQSRFQGLVHDRSDSGATVFMEPLELVDIGNEMRSNFLEIEKEVERVLRELTSQVAMASEGLERNLQTLGVVDFIMARGHLAQKMHATEPHLVDEPRLRLVRARHPLLTGDVVPIDVWLGDEFDTLIITGPNTGGKTVALKTVGLLALMTQCGLHIPADAGCEMAVWNYVYADIGDEQSIEQSLSTFSGHMTQIVKIINRVQAHKRNLGRGGTPNAPVKALVLLDEIGAGTDPTEGAALGRAILSELHSLGCRTMASTHYNDLKVYAYSTEGVQNASVEFDIKTLRPTFKLRIGRAGASNAFQIAQRLGLARSIVRRGREYLDGSVADFDEAISEVERQRSVYDERSREAASAQRALDRLQEKYADELADLQARRQRAIEEGFAEAEAVVKRAEEQAREIIADLQRQTKQSKVTQQRRDELARLRDKVAREAEEHKGEPAQPEPEPEAEPAEEEQGLPYVLMGDAVRVPALNRDGVVVEIPREGMATVQVGSLRIDAALQDLRPPHEETAKEAEALAQRMQSRKAFAVPREVDIRGMTVDEALLDLEKYLDDVALARFPMVRIVHGKGTGALRQGVHAFLRKHKQVRRFSLAEHEEGGEGATEVYF